MHNVRLNVFEHDNECVKEIFEDVLGKMIWLNDLESAIRRHDQRRRDQRKNLHKHEGDSAIVKRRRRRILSSFNEAR